MIYCYWNLILVWVLDKIATRDELKTYLGHGDFATERGWWLWGWWISYDRMTDREANDANS